MPRSIPALVEPALLVWARKTAGLTTEEAAKKAQTTPAQLAAWEAGVDYPSIPKLRLLGVAYKRPIAVFYLAEPPQDFAPLKDFRRLPQEGSRRQSPTVLLNERRALSRRYAALELYAEVEGDPPAFDLDASLDEDPERVGARLREWLEVELTEQFRWGDRRAAYNGWRAACENRGVLAFQTTGVSLEELRGFSVGEFPLPVIAVNARDAFASRSFTLLHELAHLALRLTGICDLTEVAPRPPEDQRVEVFCNAVAAAALMPRAAFLSEPVLVGTGPSTEWSDETLQVLADRYGTSKEAVLRRLLTFGRTTTAFYESRRAAWSTTSPSIWKPSGTA